MKRLFGGAGAALGAKLLTGFAVAALATTAAGVATTGSINPNDWGQQVVQQVQHCKDTLRASGVRGIGECVSAFASQHGKQVSAEHRNSDARSNSHGKNGQHGKSGEHGKPSDLPHKP